MILSIKKQTQAVGEKRFSAFHLSRPLTLRKIKAITKVKKKLTMSKSTFERLSKSVKAHVAENKIKIEIIKRAGRPIDIAPEAIIKVVQLHNAGFSVRKIQAKLGLPKSTIHYLIKKSKRNGIKYKGMKVIID